MKVLSGTYGFRPLYFSVSQNGEIPSFIPIVIINSTLTGKRLVSMPFSDHSDPLIGKNVNPEDLIQEVISYAQKEKVKYIEFRSTHKKLPFCIL